MKPSRAIQSRGRRPLAWARDALFFAIAFACLLVTCRMTLPENDPARFTPTRAVRLSLALLVVALSLITLVKGTFAAASGIVIALCWPVLMLCGRRALALAGLVVFAVSMPLLWVIANQPLDALPGFFLAQSPIISGYTDAMSTPGGLLLPLQFIIWCGLIGWAIGLIDQHRPEHLPMQVGQFLQVDGWVAIAVKDSAAPDATALILTAPDGAVTLAKGHKIARDNVNRYFQKPAMGLVGYTSFADLSGLTGDVLLGLQLTRGDQAWTCATQIPIHVGGEDSASQ